MDRDIFRGGAEMTAAMVISGTIGWFVLMSGQPVLSVVFWRCAIGAVTLLAVCMLLGLLRRDAVSPKLFGLAAIGGVAIVLNWVLLFAAYPRASIAIATTVYNVQPFMLVALGALIFKEKLTGTKLFWLGFAFAGMLLIVQAKPGGVYSGSDYMAGIALSLGAAFLYAVASIVAKRLKGTSPHLIALIQVCVGIVMLAPFADFTRLPQGMGQWGSIVTIGVVHTGLMYILLYSAIQRLPTHITGSLSFIYPVAAILVDYIAFGHALQPSQLVGSAAILIAAAGTSLGWSLRRPIPANISA
ncbi:DMT family transporter [Phyllobacterium endophyticum]|uniref:EamA family transporter n=1 Tax=Phyllobacterium endophyticum TaxID=1149773 RepID=A0A2P7B164_9HYPH|nr:DMT family transporter [Phyllobacterium endophyticum]MBB3237739.1 drug/metabolite transporter (DMT)-like permease [Phyllobacterium endophyticum]PSH60192.1 EamA family transporter [Phyllobacterium endophyticum]TYR42361.1 DMT family transporter [Phyllobacterium endophyticum]